MKTSMALAGSVAAALLLSGCAGAAFNKLDLTVSRNITIGQELIDLQAAHEKGVLSDTEYMEAKKNILNLVDQFGDLKTN